MMMLADYDDIDDCGDRPDGYSMSAELASRTAIPLCNFGTQTGDRHDRQPLPMSVCNRVCFLDVGSNEDWVADLVSLPVSDAERKEFVNPAKQPIDTVIKLFKDHVLKQEGSARFKVDPDPGVSDPNGTKFALYAIATALAMVSNVMQRDDMFYLPQKYYGIPGRCFNTSTYLCQILCKWPNTKDRDNITAEEVCYVLTQAHAEVPDP